jgi:hypothetical protein
MGRYTPDSPGEYRYDCKAGPRTASSQSAYWRREAEAAKEAAELNRWKEEQEMRPDCEDLDGIDPDVVLKVGRSMMDDIDDRINHEFMSPSVGVTAQGSERKRFRTIPEE